MRTYTNDVTGELLRTSLCNTFGGCGTNSSRLAGRDEAGSHEEKRERVRELHCDGDGNVIVMG